VHTSEMAAVGERQDPFVEFQGHVNVDTAVGLIRSIEHFFRVGKPDELSIQPEVHRQKATFQMNQQVFSSSLDGTDELALREMSQFCCRLGLRGDGVQGVDATNAAALDERA